MSESRSAIAVGAPVPADDKGVGETGSSSLGMPRTKGAGPVKSKDRQGPDDLTAGGSFCRRD